MELPAGFGQGNAASVAADQFGAKEAFEFLDLAAVEALPGGISAGRPGDAAGFRHLTEARQPIERQAASGKQVRKHDFMVIPPAEIGLEQPGGRLDTAPMLTDLRIRNFKAFGAAQRMPVRPLTLIFGPNSSGKSSLIHGLLLARHIWLGGDPDVRTLAGLAESVDLGGFDQFVHRQDAGLRVQLGLAFHLAEEAPDMVSGPIRGQHLRVDVQVGRCESPDQKVKGVSAQAVIADSKGTTIYSRDSRGEEDSRELVSRLNPEVFPEQGFPEVEPGSAWEPLRQAMKNIQSLILREDTAEFAPRPTSSSSLVAIEQPELHLHPAMQSELGDVFIESALGPNRNTFLLETHSEHLILRIMRRIRETRQGRLPEGAVPIGPEQVSVVYVEPGPSGSTIIEMPLNSLGRLVRSWPGGFFEEGFNEIFA